jgi:beta-phosphoglucomutase family hydrolase
MAQGTGGPGPATGPGRSVRPVDGILERFDALLFDLDGVVTKTAAVHATAWKQLFDEFLRQEAGGGEPFRPFRLPEDYVRHVDGRRRYDGVDTFLRSRGIELPWGSPGDGPTQRTVVGLGNRKDRFFLEAVERHGVETFEDAVALLDAARRHGRRTAVVSASENCDAILRRVGLIDRFDARVTGREAAAWQLAGKPAPDTFLKAAELLATPAARAVVLEDAISGVQAGRTGGFGLVVGVDRGGAGEALRAAGADVVVSDLRMLLDPPGVHLAADGD